MDYREQIKYALKLSNRTAKEVAATCNLPETTIYTAVKKRSAFISPKNLTKIADELGIPEFYFTNFSIDAPTAQFDIYSRVLSLPTPAINDLKRFDEFTLAEFFNLSFSEIENDRNNTPNKFCPLKYSQIAFFAVMCEQSWQFIYYGTDTPTPVNSKLYVQMQSQVKKAIEGILDVMLNYPDNQVEECYRRYDSDFNRIKKIIDKEFVLDTENLTNEDLQMISQFADMLRKKNIQTK